MANMSKRKQFDQTADNSRKPLMGLQTAKKNPLPEAGFS